MCQPISMHGQLRVKDCSKYELKILRSEEGKAHKRRNKNLAPKLHGHQIWRSSYLLIEYLKANPIPQNQNVMDIGCGWGLSGIFCAKHYAANTTLVDADKRVFPFVGLHEELNQVSIKTLHKGFGDLETKDFDAIDTVIGSDICFWPELVSDLKVLFTRALAGQVNRIIVADPGRPTFFNLAEFCQKNFICDLLQWKFGGKTKRFGHLLIIKNCR